MADSAACWVEPRTAVILISGRESRYGRWKLFNQAKPLGLAVRPTRATRRGWVVIADRVILVGGWFVVGDEVCLFQRLALVPFRLLGGRTMERFKRKERQGQVR